MHSRIEKRSLHLALILLTVVAGIFPCGCRHQSNGARHQRNVSITPDPAVPTDKAQPQLVPQVDAYVDIEPKVFNCVRPSGVKALLTTSYYSGTARWRNPDTGELLSEFPLASWPHHDGMIAVPVDTALSPDSKLLASAGNDNTIRLQDAWTGALLREMPGGRGPLVFSSDGTLIVGQNFETRDTKTIGLVKIWNVQTGQVQSIITARSEGGHSYKFSEDGKTITLGADANGRKTSQTEIYNTATGKLQESLPQSAGWFPPPGYNPYASSAALVARTQKITAQLVPMTTVALLDNGKVIASDGARIWDVFASRLIQTVPNETQQVSAVAVSPDGSLMSSGRGGSHGARLSTWDTGNNNELWHLGVDLDRSNGGRFADGGSMWTSSLSFSPDNKMLAVGSGLEQEPMSVYDARTGSQLWYETTDAIDGIISASAFSPDGSLIAGGGVNVKERKGAVTLWDAKTGEIVGTLEHDKAVQAVAFSPDGALLATGRAIARGEQSGYMWIETVQGGAVELWDVAKRTRLRTLTGHHDAVQALAFSHNGRWLASGSSDRVICLWDTASGKLIRMLVGHAGKIRSLTFTANDKAIISTSEDGTTRVWNVDNGRLSATLMFLTPRSASSPPFAGASAATPPAVPTLEWLAYTPEGYFDASPGAEPFIRWRVGDRLFPAQKYRKQYFKPSLVRRALQIT